MEFLIAFILVAIPSLSAGVMAADSVDLRKVANITLVLFSIVSLLLSVFLLKFIYDIDSHLINATWLILAAVISAIFHYRKQSQNSKYIRCLVFFVYVVGIVVMCIG
ncbi:MAG: hypothetical protein RBU27_05540 [Bacteroidota bacterium]|jgi:ABC-type iron transport system FetAB permease component|nr:hypothetical protein [Bacteroidota bacterium]